MRYTCPARGALDEASTSSSAPAGKDAQPEQRVTRTVTERHHLIRQGRPFSPLSPRTPGEGRGEGVPESGTNWNITTGPSRVTQFRERRLKAQLPERHL